MATPEREIKKSELKPCKKHCGRKTRHITMRVNGVVQELCTECENSAIAKNILQPSQAISLIKYSGDRPMFA